MKWTSFLYLLQVKSTSFFSDLFIQLELNLPPQQISLSVILELFAKVKNTLCPEFAKGKGVLSISLVHEIQKTDSNSLGGCPVLNNRKPVRLKNVSTRAEAFDSLHSAKLCGVSKSLDIFKYMLSLLKMKAKFLLKLTDWLRILMIL